MISQETFNQLSTYLDEIHINATSLTVKEGVTDDELILTSLACLLEESGEVATEVRKMLGVSFSKKKVAGFQKTDLEEEICDVLITLLLLCKQVGIQDLDVALLDKIKKNNKRGY